MFVSIAIRRESIGKVKRGSQRTFQGSRLNTNRRFIRISLFTEIEKSRADLEAREKNLPAETEDHEERMKDWRTEQRAINDELAGARAEIQQLESQIPPRDRAEFHRLVDKKHGLAVVLVSGSSCSACHVKVRPAAMQALKQGREIIYCDSCKRILYYEPANS